MPYIPFRRRLAVRPGNIDYEDPRTAGELNYQLTALITDYYHQHGHSYQTMNDIIGALDNAKDEFRRRVIHPYEDRKLAENGDVYAPLEDS